MKKKTFKRAGVAVLSMAMLLSMGAVAATSVSATATASVTINNNKSNATFKYYKLIPSSTDGSGITTYSTTNNTFDDNVKSEGKKVADFFTVSGTADITVKGVTGITDGTSLKDITDHSGQAQKLAKALFDQLDTTTSEGVTTHDGGLAIDSNTQLDEGYYLIISDEVNSAPILAHIKGNQTTPLTIEPKIPEVTIDKTITAIDNNRKSENLISTDGKTGIAAAGATITYQLKSQFPTYDTTQVKATVYDGEGKVVTPGTNITDFVITDIPENTITIVGLDKEEDSDKLTELAKNVKVYLNDTENESLVASTNYTLKLVEANTALKSNAAGVEDKYFTDGTNDTAGVGFKIIFKDDYVINNRAKDVYVTFNATLSSDPDVYDGTTVDTNKNEATVEYNNNYYTGGSPTDDKGDTKTPTIDTGNPPTTPPSDTPDEDLPPETPNDDKPENPNKNDKSTADVYCTIFTVNKKDNNQQALNGATFSLYKDYGESKQTLVKQIVGTDTATFAFKGLGEGTYTLVEDEAPADYIKGNNVTFEVKATKDDAGKEYAGSFTFESKTDGVTITNQAVDVVNTKGQTLPGTGGIGTTLFTVGGAAVVLVAGFMFVLYMRKKNDAEE